MQGKKSSQLHATHMTSVLCGLVIASAQLVVSISFSTPTESTYSTFLCPPGWLVVTASPPWDPPQQAEVAKAMAVSLGKLAGGKAAH